MRLGLDIGTNSIGWWLYQTDANNDLQQHITGGVRIFSDGRNPKSKSGQSLAVARRDARAARRKRDRYLRRRSVLMKTLANSGLMPNDPLERKALEALDPYELRAIGLVEQLPLSYLGRALFHINQRRGFKSNRKADGKDNESGKIKDGAARLDQAMMAAGAKTYGDFLHKRRQDNATTPVRTRLGLVTSEDGKETSGYNFYPTRQMFEEEFQKLWAAQAPFYPDILSDALFEEIQRIIFFQRPLKAPKIGLCLFEDEERLSKAHPVFQDLRLYQTINSLRIRKSDQSERSLTIDERNALILVARKKKKVTFTTLRRTLKLGSDQAFTLERGNRKDIEGHEIEVAFCKSYGDTWVTLDTDQQWEIIETLRNAEATGDLIGDLVTNFGISPDVAEQLAFTPLPDGYGRLGKTASVKILSELISDVIPYSEAATRIYGSHSDDATGEILNHLPYYGEVLQRHVIPGSMDDTKHHPTKDAAEYWGRITNPTVHIGLNQLRLLLNDLINIYGIPDRITVELARDLKNGDKKKAEINANIKKATDAANKRSERLAEMGIKNTGDARMRLRLWGESHPDVIKRNCPYCTQSIGAHAALDGTQTQIDHILPYSRTMDDSPSNKVLCHSLCNQEKRNKTPFEAWGANANRWASISANMKNLGPKAWRFAPDAMEKFEGERHFENRQLTDTQYLSKIARSYLSRLYPDPDTAPVQVVPGQLTEMLRRKWGLNEFLHDADIAGKEKNRQDHRHHAIDAAVIAATDIGLLQKISKSAARNQDMGRNVLKDIDVPFDGFREGLKAVLDTITVSHKQDHGTVGIRGQGSSSGQLHNETAYGLLEDGYVVTRKPIDQIKPGDINKIRDPRLKDILLGRTRDLSGAAFTKALENFCDTSPTYRGIRRVRLVEKLNVIPIHDPNGKAYKGYKGDSNHCLEVWKLPFGEWQSCILTTFDANQNGLGSTRPHPGAKLIMRLFNKDAVALDHPKHGYIQMTIATIAGHNLTLFQGNQGNVDARNRDKNDPFKYVNVGTGTLKKYNLRKIGIDRLGRVTDPGPIKS